MQADREDSAGRPIDDFYSAYPAFRQPHQALLQGVGEFPGACGFFSEGLRQEEKLVFDFPDFALDAGLGRLSDDHLLRVELVRHDGVHLPGGPHPEENSGGQQRDDGDVNDGHDGAAG